MEKRFVDRLGGRQKPLIKHINDYKAGDWETLSRHVKANNGVVKLVVHHGSLGGDYGEGYAAHLKRVKQFIEGKEPVFCMAVYLCRRHPEGWADVLKSQSETLASLEPKAPVTVVDTLQADPTPFFKEMFGAVPRSLRQYIKKMDDYEHSKGDDAWKKFGELLKQVGVKEVIIAGEEGFRSDPSEIELRHLDGKEIEFLYKEMMAKPGQKLLDSGCVYGTVLSLMKHVPSIKVRVAEGLVYFGEPGEE